MSTVTDDNDDVKALRFRVTKYTTEWPDTTWHAARHLTVKRVWDWFGDHGCFIGPDGGNPMGPEYNHLAMTDPAHTPFECLYFHPPSAAEPHAFIAVRPLSHKIWEGKRMHDPMGLLGDIRANLSDKKTGLEIISLSPMLVCRPATDSEEEDRDWPPEASCETTEATLVAAYGPTLVKWV